MAIPTFSRSGFPLVPTRILCDQTGSGKSKMAASTLEMNASPLPDKLLPSILTDVVEFVFYGGSENRILIKKSKAGSISLLTYMAVVLICK